MFFTLFAKPQIKCTRYNILQIYIYITRVIIIISIEIFYLNGYFIIAIYLKAVFFEFILLWIVV
jgi:hypothetical protein